MFYCTLLEHFDQYKADGFLFLYEFCFGAGFAIVQIIENYHIDCISSALVKEVVPNFLRKVS